MPRTKGSKNRVTASADFDAQIAKLQKDKAMLEEGLSKTVAHIEELKQDIKSLREGLKPQKAEIKQTDNVRQGHTKNNWRNKNEKDHCAAAGSPHGPEHGCLCIQDHR